MVVETSALIAILLGEPEAEEFMALLYADHEPLLSGVALLETTMVYCGRTGPQGRAEIDRVIKISGIQVVPFSVAEAEFARTAWLRYGKGRHPAGLNFGDCCSYALAKLTGLPLLYKGRDFALTDIPAALPR